ncbi:MAG: M28 family peptidase [Taibaiella sp.]|nr:M28 family peptidase [Taibaiella sp.]
MKNKNILLFTAAILSLFISGCNNASEPPPTTDSTAPTSPKPVATPDFPADSAYRYIEQQLSYGPRVPGSKAQRQCADWMETQLKLSCDTAYRQQTTVKAGNGQSLPCINLIGVINPAATKRILLLTHWDSRPWADHDTKDTDKPILAADDGGSGTGVLLALAQQIKSYGLPQSIGIDILLTDVEDYGKTEWGDDSYCLGTQYWAHNPHVAGYKASFGILLDMVGAKGAQFPMEGGSMRMAGDVQQKVWKAAGTAGYSSWFPYAPGSEITDDHVPVNVITGIKTIDIIHLTPDPQNPFPAHWHTHADNMSVIDKGTLKAVGQTLLQVIYEEATTEVN